MKQPTTLQSLIHQNGPLSNMLATSYVNAVANQLEHLHKERHICHLDVRPDMIVIDAEGKAQLKESTLSQSFSEAGAETDFRDLKAVHHYLLTGKKCCDAVRQEAGELQPEKPLPTPSTTPPAENSYLKKLFTTIGVAFLLCMAGYFLTQRLSSKAEHFSGTVADVHYEGEWKDGKPHGQGIARYYDGRYYEGTFVKGKRSDKHARFVYADGNVFEGKFADDTIRSGKVTLKSGDFYFVGDFSNGQPYSGYWYRSADDKRVEQVIKGKEKLL